VESLAPARVAILGSGSLARAVCYGLAVAGGYPIEVFVIARSRRAAGDLAQVAGVRAVQAARPVEFQPIVAELADPVGLADLLAGLAPHGALLCASTQSPWERLSAPSAWTALVERAGFGLTLPLHTELALHAGRALHQARPGAWFLNACFPDAVNPVLAALGVPVLAGIGNVALLAAGLQAAIGVPDASRLALLAHHLHLHEPARPGDEALAWCDGAPLDDLGDRLAAHRSVARPELNHVTGFAGALLLRDLLAEAEVDTHAPGPEGRPGGYPVRIGPRGAALRLPAGVTEAEAVAANQRWAELDGVRVDAERVTFGPTASTELRAVAPGLAEGFPVRELAGATAVLHRLRDRLRRQPEARLSSRPDHRRNDDDVAQPVARLL